MSLAKTMLIASCDSQPACYRKLFRGNKKEKNWQKEPVLLDAIEHHTNDSEVQ